MVFIPPKSAQVNFLWGKNDVRTAIQQFYTPKKLLYPQNKFLATPLPLSGIELFVITCGKWTVGPSPPKFLRQLSDCLYIAVRLLRAIYKSFKLQDNTDRHPTSDSRAKSYQFGNAAAVVRRQSLGGRGSLWRRLA